MPYLVLCCKAVPWQVKVQHVYNYTLNEIKTKQVLKPIYGKNNEKHAQWALNPSNFCHLQYLPPH